MPADSPTPATPPPTTPNRWRRRAARLWWWMLPGMIATIVGTFVAFERNRRDPYGSNRIAVFPASALTALGWTPAGRPLTQYNKSGWFRFGWSTEYVLVSCDFTKGSLAEVRAWYPYFRDEDIMAGATISGFGLPFPWLMRCTLSVSSPGTQEVFRTSGFSEFSFLCGVVPVAEPITRDAPFFEGVDPSSNSVSPFVYDYLTYYPDPLGFLLNTAVFSTLWMPITSWYRRRKSRYTNCTRCGYSREGLAPNAVCPECGQKPVH